MNRLLIADDEKIERDALRFIINKKCDYIDEIAEAVNGRQAVKMAGSFHPDIAFLDIKMPGVNGIEAAKIIRSLNPCIKIVFLTAYDYFDYAHEAIKLGADDFIIKPASEERVLQVLEKLSSQTCREQEVLDKKRLSEERFKKACMCLENELIKDLREGSLSEAQKKLYLEVMDFRLVNALAGVLKIDNETHTSLLTKRALDRLRSILQEKRIRFFFGQDKDDLLLLFVPPEEEYPEDIDIFLQQAARTISMEFSITVSLGLSAPFSSPDDSRRAFNDAGRAVGDTGNPVTKQLDPRYESMEKAKKFIEKHYTEEISLERISREVNLSPFYFCKLFKSHTGKSLSDYIALTRIERAKELLRLNSCSLKELGAMVGYSDPNYLARVFRRIVGIPPSRYRAEYGYKPK